jgi:hypothetical protein
MERQNGHKQEVLGHKQRACLLRSPDMIIFEISLLVMFYEGIEQENEVLDQLEFTAEEMAKMLDTFKGGGFLPMNCRICWNTKLTKQHLQRFDHS